jgi:predicted O-methyltransferase YrrM
MILHRMSNMLTAGAVRTLVFGSPVRTVTAGAVAFIACASVLRICGFVQLWALATALSLLIVLSAALIYARNERHYQQLEAMVRLASSLELSVPLPPFRGWKLSPDAAVFLVQHLRNLRAEQVVEIGCGASTVLIASVLKQQGAGTVIALEHDSEQAALCRRQLRLFGLESQAIVLHAPLISHSINGDSWLWYDLSELTEKLPMDVSIDLLLIDGPPVWTQKLARYPALPLLAPRLRNPGGVILLDDASRVSERRVVRRWQREFSAMAWTNEATEDGLAVGVIRPQEADECQ